MHSHIPGHYLQFVEKRSTKVPRPILEGEGSTTLVTKGLLLSYLLARNIRSISLFSSPKFSLARFMAVCKLLTKTLREIIPSKNSKSNCYPAFFPRKNSGRMYLPINNREEEETGAPQCAVGKSSNPSLR